MHSDKRHRRAAEDPRRGEGSQIRRNARASARVEPADGQRARRLPGTPPRDAINAFHRAEG
jgi:hypothetical protein